MSKEKAWEREIGRKSGREIVGVRESGRESKGEKV